MDKLKKSIFILLIFLTACAPSSTKIEQSTNDYNIGGDTNFEEFSPSEVIVVDGLEQSNKASKETIDSIYKYNLTEDEKTVFNHILKGIERMDGEISIPINISEDKLRLIMRILILDNPQLYYLDREYSYNVLDEKLSSISPKYILDEKQKTDADRNLSEYKNTLTDEKTQYEVIDEVVSRSFSGLRFTSPVDAIDYSSYNWINNLKTTYIETSLEGINQAMVLQLREQGVEASIIYGELITDNFIFDKYQSLRKDNGQFIESVSGDTSKKVSIDTSRMYSWVIVKINNSWYHVDLQNMLAINQIGEADYELDFSQNESNPFFLMNDSQASASKLFMKNEEILGVQPMADNENFTTNYRADKTFNDIESSAIFTELNDKLLMQTNTNKKSSSFLLYISSTDIYESTSSMMSILISNFSTKNKDNAMKSYQIWDLPYAQTIFLYDVIYK